MVGVAVRAVLVVGDQHVRAVAPHQGDEFARRLVAVGVVEVVGPRVGLAARHTRVAIIEQFQVSDPQYVDGLAQLFATYLPQAGPGLFRVEIGIMYLALLATRSR